MSVTKKKKKKPAFINSLFDIHWVKVFRNIFFLLSERLNKTMFTPSRNSLSVVHAQMTEA